MRCIAIRTTRAWCHNLCALRLVERQLTSFPLYVIGISGILPYNRNLTLQTCPLITWEFFRLHSTFARLYNAAASPASRLRSAGSLAIILQSKRGWRVTKETSHKDFILKLFLKYILTSVPKIPGELQERQFQLYDADCSQVDGPSGSYTHFHKP